VASKKENDHRLTIPIFSLNPTNEKEITSRDKSENIKDNNTTLKLPNLKLNLVLKGKPQKEKMETHLGLTGLQQLINSQKSKSLTTPIIVNPISPPGEEKENSSENLSKCLPIQKNSDSELISSKLKLKKLKRTEHKSVSFSKAFLSQLLNGNVNDINKINISNNNDFPDLNEMSKELSYEIGKWAFISKPGKNCEGKTKTNQDSFLVKEKIFGFEGYNIFGVFDGHGRQGHLVSNEIKQNFTEYYTSIENFIKEGRCSNSYNSKLTSSALALKEENICKKINENNYAFVKQSFNVVSEKLIQTKFDVDFSGAACVLVLVLKDRIICANAGDSRAVMFLDGDVLQPAGRVIPLSRDHKPDDAEELKRIIKQGGRIDKTFDENGIKAGPNRVWLKYEDYPGLAMSRSIGDFVAETVGVIHEPEILEFKCNYYDAKFIVIASDGIWEYLSNEEVCEIVNFYYKLDDPIEAANKLVKEATKRWKEEDCVIDDITAVVVFCCCKGN